MKILHLVTQEDGGAGKAAIRLHQALLEHGVNSLVIVQDKISDLQTIHENGNTKVQKTFSWIRRILDRFPTFFYSNKKKDIFSSTFFPNNHSLIKQIFDFNPDVIHLHWINFGFINLDDLLRLNKPILWSLHDENTYTGGCHYTENGCTRFKTQCGYCPLLNSKKKFDISFLNFQKKKRIYNQINLTINGLSRWIANNAKSSALLRDKEIINLPNTINTRIFRPIGKHVAKNLFGIAIEKKLLGFGAISATTTKRKGYIQLKKALKNLPNKHLYALIVFGSSHGEAIDDIETIFLGHLYDDMSLTIMYNTLDVLIVPSLAENLSNTILESLSCGTPVVAFDIGGNSDLIKHKKNGYLAKNTEDLRQGILYCVEHQTDLSKEAREKVLDEFGYNTIAQRYIKEYKKRIHNECNQKIEELIQ